MRQAELVVFSHLRWDFVFQRPQHLLSRLARGRRVIFIEEPMLDKNSQPRVELTHVDESLLVVRPFTPIEAPGFAEAQMPILRQLVAKVVQEQAIQGCVAWFYTPLALPLLDAVPHELVVYDCMDALDAFLNAPVLLKQREQQLLDVADLVFTGGPSLYRRLQGRHPHAHCFSSSVDAKHFAQAKTRGTEPLDQKDIGSPRLGYFGVIDERIDLQLVDAVAQQHPDWQILMVGPVVKISESELPRRSNIHYLGQKQYAELPDYVAGWDVCLMPFARNDSTRYISPTKTLEYMAAEKPIVSTSITDVSEPYGHIVPIEDDPVRFARACEAALNETPAQRKQRLESMREVLASTSWESTAQRMEALIQQSLQAKQQGDAGATRQSSQPGRTSSVAGVAKASGAAEHPVVIIGAGPTGLSAAYHLGKEACVVDQNQQVGGWCRSVQHDGFTFDYAGHIMFSNDPYVHELYKTLLGDNVHWQDREAWVYSKQTYTRYPFQACLYGLPVPVIKECILGAIEARYGIDPTKAAASKADAAKGAAPKANTAVIAAEKVNGNGNGNASSLSVCREGDVKDCCGDGVLESTAKLVTAPAANGHGNGHTNGHDAAANAQPKNFEEFIYKVWGAGIAKHFAVPYNRKLWAVPLAEMETSWLGGRVPMPDLGEMIEGALQPVGKPMGPNARFGYPLRGGFQALMDGFLPHIEDQLMLGRKVTAVSPSARTVTLNDGTVLAYEQLISTMPLPVLIRLMGDEAPAEVQQAAAGLRHVSVRCVNLGIGRENLTDKHWIYYPEETVFHRIFVQGNASPYCNRPGGFGLTCEITYSPHKPLPCDGEALVQRCIDDCRAVGIIREDDPIWTSMQVDMPFAYVVYDHARPKNIATIRKWLVSQDVTLSGRYSEWEYYNSDHAFIAGKKAAEEVKEARATGRVIDLSVRNVSGARVASNA